MRTIISLNERDTTLAEALKLNNNVLLVSLRAQARSDFEQGLWQQRSSIEALIRHHLALTQSDAYDVLPRTGWRPRPLQRLRFGARG
ncbi:hypothetical protein SEUCBS139899_010474 [Sporothrix eucalyptigena]